MATFTEPSTLPRPTTSRSPGYIDTQDGPVTTTVAQNINFSNLQDFQIEAASYVQDINQNTVIRSNVTTRNAGGVYVDSVDYNWPLKLDIVLNFNSDGTIVQTTSVNQYYERDEENKRDGQATAFSILQDRVISHDALDLNSSFQITGNQDQSSTQRYFASDSSGYCYGRDITAAASVLTNIINGQGCN